MQSLNEPHAAVICHEEKNSLEKCFETFKVATAPGFAVGARVSGMSVYTIDGTRTIIFPQLLTVTVTEK